MQKEIYAENPCRQRRFGKCIAKGRRAKRGRRKEFNEVYLNCGMITRSELEAIEGLKALRGMVFKKRRSWTLPKEIEGICEHANKCVAYVSNDGLPEIEFWIPQVAFALNLNERILEFIIQILVLVQVVKGLENGAFIWAGKNGWLQHTDENTKQQRNRRTYEQNDARSRLEEICSSSVDVLKMAKGPLWKETLRKELVVRLPWVQTKQGRDLLEQVIAVLLGSGIIHNSQPNYNDYNKSHPVSSSYPSPDDHKRFPSCISQTKPIKEDIRMVQEPVKMNGRSVSIPNMEDKVMFTNAIMDSLAKRLNMTWTAVNKDACQDTESTNSPMQAAVLKVSGSEISQLGVVDILGHGSLKCVNNESTNSVIALAVPQWMLASQQLPRQAQSHIFEVTGMSKRTFPSDQPNMYMSCLPMNRSSLTDLLENVSIFRELQTRTQIPPRYP